MLFTFSSIANGIRISKILQWVQFFLHYFLNFKPSSLCSIQMSKLNTNLRIITLGNIRRLKEMSLSSSIFKAQCLQLQTKQFPIEPFQSSFEALLKRIHCWFVFPTFMCGRVDRREASSFLWPSNLHWGKMVIGGKR